MTQTTLLARLRRAHPQSEEGALRHEAAAEIERLREDCAEAYQVVAELADMAGVFDDPQVVMALDNLAAAAQGDPRPHADLPPFVPKHRT